MALQVDTVFIWVTDLDSALAWYSAIGIEPSDPEVTNTGVARFTTFTDPDSNDIQLLQRPEA